MGWWSSEWGHPGRRRRGRLLVIIGQSCHFPTTSDRVIEDVSVTLKIGHQAPNVSDNHPQFIWKDFKRDVNWGSSCWLDIIRNGQWTTFIKCKTGTQWIKDEIEKVRLKTERFTIWTWSGEKRFVALLLSFLTSDAFPVASSNDSADMMVFSCHKVQQSSKFLFLQLYCKKLPKQF